MQNFDIVKSSKIEKTYRVARIMGDYDVQEKHAQERFCGTIDTPQEWNIGVIVGSSGTGKTTIAKELFNNRVYKASEKNYTHASVIDDMPQNCTVDEIERMFYAVGFGSVPSWLKPYSVLSNGEKMRVDMAKAMLENDFVVFDEFTSVVDRNVAQVASMAISKAVRKQKKKFVAVTCHRDVLEWLQPDWVFDTDVMKMVFSIARDRSEDLRFESAGEINGKNLDVIII